jgi:hypothetical protein
VGRQALRITILLGVLFTLVGGTGIFAVFSDRALTGPSDVNSAELVKAADLLIAAAQPQDPMNSGPFSCDPYSDNLVTPLMTFTTNVGGGNERFVCLVNVGSSAVDLSLTAVDLADLDTDCTGDEAAFGDATCGLDQTTMAPQGGELSPTLTVETDLYDCLTGSGLLTPGAPDFSATLSGLAAGPQSLETLQPNGQVCVRLRVYWRPTGDAAQISQSDEATWRFAFDGTVPSN